MKKWNEIVMESNNKLTPQEFVDQANKEFEKLFPKSYHNIRLATILGDVVSFSFGILARDKIPSNIVQNDPAFHSGLIQDLKNKNEFEDKITIDFTSASLAIKPDNPYMAYGRLKTGWRKKTGTPEQVLKHFVDYLKKLRKTIDDNFDKFHEREQELMRGQ